MATASFANLKFTAAKKGAIVPPIQQRRNKLSKRLWEQIQLAKAQQGGTQFSVTKFRSITDTETGMRKQIEMPKRLKAWWFTADNGKTAVCVRYGARVLELAKGKFAVEVSNASDLVPTLELIKNAVEAGELDAQMEATAGNLRSGFKR